MSYFIYELNLNDENAPNIFDEEFLPWLEDVLRDRAIVADEDRGEAWFNALAARRDMSIRPHRFAIAIHEEAGNIVGYVPISFIGGVIESNIPMRERNLNNIKPARMARGPQRQVFFPADDVAQREDVSEQMTDVSRDKFHSMS